MKIGNSEIEKLYIGENEVGKLYLGTDLIYEKGSGPDYSKMPLTFEITSSGTICWKANNTAYTVTLEYSKNGGEWTEITSNTGTSAPTITVESGDTVQFRGNNATLATNNSSYNTFDGTSCNFRLYGNIMSILNKNNFSTADTLQSAYTFNSLFRYCGRLRDASNLVLPATTLVDYCYENMFYNCTGLTTAPALPATTLADRCYENMFFNCTILTTAPALPATTLANYCYNIMFSNCTSITTAPELPATTLANYCYFGMFQNCTGLTTAPELPATTLAYYCYRYMFQGCNNLNYIKCLATNPSTNDTQNWVNGVASTGTFVKAAGVTWSEGTSGIPTGWTIQDNV